MLSLQKSAAGFALGAFFVLFSSTAWGAEWNCPAFGTTQPVTVAKVIDGDTVRLADGRKVRLIGINAPELGHDGKPGQPFARAAQKALQRFLGKHARLLLNTDKTDNHRRTLGHLYNLNGESAEAHLLKQGLAWHVAVPPNLTLADCLADAEQLARENHEKLWSPHGIAPTAANNINSGGFQRITGKITKIHFGKRGWWLNFGEQLAAVIYPQHQHRFDRNTLASLEGKTATIRGWVYPSRSKKHQPWRVKLETPYGLEISGLEIKTLK